MVEGRWWKVKTEVGSRNAEVGMVERQRLRRCKRKWEVGMRKGEKTEVEKVRRMEGSRLGN
jgi:hypothetical protein